MMSAIASLNIVSFVWRRPIHRRPLSCLVLWAAVFFLRPVPGYSSLRQNSHHSLAKLWVSELQNPKTIVTKFDLCHLSFMYRLRDITSAIWPSKPKFKPIAPVGGVNPWNGWSITLVVFIFFVCDPNLCSRPETKPENRFLRCLIHRM